MIDSNLLTDLQQIVGPDNVVDDLKKLNDLSRDCYWYSPVLRPELDGMAADCIVSPATLEELCAVIAAAVRTSTPITCRGAGTGNYGQGVPMHGGILLSTVRLDRILSLDAEKAHVQAGTRLIEIERRARAIGAEMRFYPSTIITSTAAGFIAGGAGGPGSIMHGTVWDEGNILGATIVTAESTPRIIQATTYAGMRSIIHSCGLTCIIADVTFALTPAVAWQQHILAFEDFDVALTFSAALARDTKVKSRLLSLHEWPIPSYFVQLVKNGAAPDGKHLLLIEAEMSLDEVTRRATSAGATVTWHQPHADYHKTGKLKLSDFSYNHTTLWAMKADENLTYLQDAFDISRLTEQHHARKAIYGDDVLTHIEFLKWGGVMTPGGLSLVRFKSKDQLWKLIADCETLGMWVANPHTHKLDEDVRWNGQPILDGKAMWDPKGLLNPGHMAGL